MNETFCEKEWEREKESQSTPSTSATGTNDSCHAHAIRLVNYVHVLADANAHAQRCVHVLPSGGQRRNIRLVLARVNPLTGLIVRNRPVRVIELKTLVSLPLVSHLFAFVVPDYLFKASCFRRTWCVRDCWKLLEFQWRVGLESSWLYRLTS